MFYQDENIIFVQIFFFLVCDQELLIYFQLFAFAQLLLFFFFFFFFPFFSFPISCGKMTSILLSGLLRIKIFMNSAPIILVSHAVPMIIVNIVMFGQINDGRR